MAKMWSGRFKKELSEKVNDFNSSLCVDRVMFEEDIRGSVAHARMLSAVGIIEPGESEKIIGGLLAIEAELKDGSLSLPEDAEDIHMAVEQLLTERIGAPGKRLHTARSRNDQVALDIRLYLRERISKITESVKALAITVCDMAEEHTETVMPGYTHLQRAQPVSFGHYIMAYAQMLARDLARLRDCSARMNQCPLGAGALAASTFPIDREMVAKELKFDGLCENSMDAVSDRDFAIEFSGALSIFMMHLSRFSEEIILWCSSEFGFIELDDAYSTGSSIMPQKKNPDVAELCRGKCARVYGDLMTLLTVMKALPLAYNKDMQEDKEAVFDAADTAETCAELFCEMLRTVSVNKDRMRQAAAGGFINATDCADYLVKKGMPFRDAYRITGELVALCIEKKTDLTALPLEDYRSKSELFDEGIYGAVDLITCLKGRAAEGGPSPEAVKRQIARLRKKINFF